MNPQNGDKIKQKQMADIEKRAISLLKLYAKEKIERDAFGEVMFELQREFLQAMKDENGVPTFHHYTPMWLNYFLAFKFIDWDKARQMHNEARQHPHLTSSPDWPQFEAMVAERDRHFMQDVKSELEQLKRQKGVGRVIEKFKKFFSKNR